MFIESIQDKRRQSYEKKGIFPIGKVMKFDREIVSLYKKV
ncbi:hypothetical protein HMPREF1154_0549 [Capnocytophaga sp. CM59]|nr:hypothetical protein HMPREF1154_0549 [Capnocytophaga sp. CM59]